MPLNYIGSKNNNSAGLRILHITLAFRIIWHRKNPNVTVRICLIFLHRTSLVDMTCFLLNMKFIIRAAIRVMAETNFIRPENYSLIEAIDLFSDDRNNKPLAIVAKLQPVIFEQRPQPQIVQQIIFWP